MLLTSPAFKNGQPIPKGYTCDGDNENPELHIQYVPDEARSLVLIMDDPDSPQGTFTHWLVWNINPKTTVIGKNSVPQGGIQGVNGAGRYGYMGPCPSQPGTVHHYHFKLYALNEQLTLPHTVSKEELETECNNYLVTQTEFIGTYER